MFGPEKGKDGKIGKTDEELIRDLISIHNAENWLGGDGDDFAPSFFGGGTDDIPLATPTPVSRGDYSTEQVNGDSQKEVAVTCASPEKSNKDTEPVLKDTDSSSADSQLASKADEGV